MLEDVVNSLPGFGGVYCFLSQRAIVVWYWELYDLSEDSGINSVEEHSHCFSTSSGITSHLYQLFEVRHIFIDEVSCYAPWGGRTMRT